MNKKENIVRYEVKIIWNNGQEEIRSDVPYCKSLEYWLDAVEEDERDQDNE